MPTSLDKRRIAAVAGFVLLCMFCAHAFCYMNLSFSGASVLVDVSRETSAQIAEGLILAPFYWQIRGSLSSPMLVGLLSTLFLLGSAALIADLLELTHTASLFSLCGVLTLHISVTAINASMLHMADAYFLALLFAIAGAYLCVRFRFGFLPGAVCFFLCLGLQSAMLPAAIALLWIKAIHSAAQGRAMRSICCAGARTFLSILLGAALYAAGLFLLTNHRGLTLEASLQWPVGMDAFTLSGLLRAWIAPIEQLLFPITAYTKVSTVISGALLALGIAAFAVNLHECPPAVNRTFAAVAMLLLPFVFNFPIFSHASSGTTALTYAFCFLPVWIIATLDRAYASLRAPLSRCIRRVVACAFGVIFLGSIVFANQVYLKKNLEYQSTLSVMTRVIERAERTEGFEPGYTPVAVIGSLDNSILAVPREGFEHLDALDAASNRFTAASQDDNLWYFWEIMGYPFNFVSTMECEELAASDAVRQMPAFPKSGCCQMLNGTLVIKLSDSL